MIGVSREPQSRPARRRIPLRPRAAHPRPAHPASRPSTRSSHPPGPSARRRPAKPVVDDGRRGPGGVVRDDRVIGIEDQRAGGVDEFREPALDAPVRLQRAVAVEVVRGHVGVDRDGRAARQGRRAGARTARRRRDGRRELREPLDDGDADVAAEDDWMRWVASRTAAAARRSWSCPSSRSPRSWGRGTSAGTGPARRPAPGALAIGLGPRCDERGERRAQPRLGRREVRVDRWRGRHEGRAGPRRRPDRPPARAPCSTGRPSSAAMAARSSDAGRPS